jgi:RimJ/RimL family protein N-acetyltransferase
MDGTQQQVRTVLRWLKEGPPGAIPVEQEGRPAALLQAVGWRDAADAQAVDRLARWREQANPYFPAQFPVTHAGTRRWLVEQLLGAPERVLFWVKGADGAALGHLGLFRFDFARRTVEIDNVVRGVMGVAPGVMGAAVAGLCAWASEALDMAGLFLRVLADNDRALRLYERCGFAEVRRVPLRRVEEGDTVRWVEAEAAGPAVRALVIMRRQAGGLRGQAA